MTEEQREVLCQLRLLVKATRDLAEKAELIFSVSDGTPTRNQLSAKQLEAGMRAIAKSIGPICTGNMEWAIYRARD